MIMELRVLLRLVPTHIIRQAAKTVNNAYDTNTAGSTVIYMDRLSQGCFQAAAPFRGRRILRVTPA